MFVLGLHRSGTTWLANILANHPRIVAVQSEDHFGVHESIFFSHFARAYGDIADEGNFARFVADFTTSDYYVLTGLPAQWLADRRPRTYAEAFRAVMEELAHRGGGADMWLEKSPHHTLLAEELASGFPDARFVAIVRRPAAVLASHLWANGRPPPYPARLNTLARLAASYSLNVRSLRRFCRRRATCLLLTYEQLVADPAGETRRVCDFLGVAFVPRMLELPWKRNTSFRAGGSRAHSLTALDRAVIAVGIPALRLVPLSVLRRLASRRRRDRELEWPVWCWRRRDAGVLQ